jgi:hypothetical protein
MPTQFTLRFLMLAVALVALVCALFASLPPFPKFVPSFPRLVLGVSALAATPALLSSVLKHPLGELRFWLSLVSAVLLGTGSGVWSAYYCNQAHVHQVQWPNIGGAFIVLGVGFVVSACVASMAALIFPRRKPM